MKPSYRHGVPLLLMALVLVTGCTPPLELRGDNRLEGLLPPPTAYPEGFDVDQVRVEELDEGTDNGGYTRVEPEQCGAVLSGGTGWFPEGAEKGAAQIADPLYSSLGSVVYGYVHVSGDFGDTPVEGTGFERLLDSCDQLTAHFHGDSVDGTLVSETSPSLPEGGGMTVLTLSSGEETEKVTRTAWGQVGDVYFVLVAMHTISPADAPVGALSEACRDDVGMECTQAQEEELVAEAIERQAKEFESVLAQAVEGLETVF
ncbi:hypothetical protein [Nocardiopsis halotolerans]|uniref:hypothetical protein n=1 Tax=Nocardiopsis halotolerans TaxID=124252 RepID=UPI00034657EF|nr:hypothetical protein [Nocardiopsis halotolerans]